MRTSTPRYLCFVDTETVPYPINNGERHYLWFGWALFLRIDNDTNTKTNRGKWFRFESAYEFWRICDSFITKGTKLYLFAHNWRFDGAILQAESIPLEFGYKCEFYPLDSPSFFMTYKNADKKKTISMIDSTNYYKQSLASLGEMKNAPKLPMPDYSDDPLIWDEYCKNDVIVLSKAILSWIEYIKEFDLGSFAKTLPAQAFNAFTHLFQDIPIYIHDNEDVNKLERRSYHGARTEAFFQGKIKEEIYYLDVNSLYPSVMKNNLYPYYLDDSGDSLTIEELIILLSDYSVIADVLINTEEDIYALRTPERLLFPIGTFRTTLTTPELIHAIKNNHIKEIGNWASYCHETYFNSYVDFFYNERLKFKDAGNDSYSFISKLFLNSLYGKFGQRSNPWLDIGEASIEDDDHYIDIDIDDGTREEYRIAMGRKFKKLPPGESNNSFPAVAAHVTAFARMKMMELMEFIGRENIYYTDTDSLFVNKTGFEKCKETLIGQDLGLLKLEKQSSNVTIFNPKDYIFADDVKIKGIRKNAEKLAENKYKQVQFTSWQTHLKKGETGFVDIVDITKTLDRTYKKGIVKDNGWISPFRINLEY